MHVNVWTGALPGTEVTISNSALALVRGGFNPSARPQVDVLKALGAAIISELEKMRDDRAHPGSREAAIAITQLQGATMFAVAAATAGA
jgi:hypothetical protein